MADYSVSDIVNALRLDGHKTVVGFGSFKVVDVPERSYRNPKTGEPVVKAAHQVVKFKPSKTILSG